MSSFSRAKQLQLEIANLQAELNEIELKIAYAEFVGPMQHARLWGGHGEWTITGGQKMFIEWKDNRANFVDISGCLDAPNRICKGGLGQSFTYMMNGEKDFQDKNDNEVVIWGCTSRFYENSSSFKSSIESTLRCE